MQQAETLDGFLFAQPAIKAIIFMSFMMSTLSIIAAESGLDLPLSDSIFPN